MIEVPKGRKSLKRKHLRGLSTSEDITNLGPSLDRRNTDSIPSLDRNHTASLQDNGSNLKGKITKLIKLILIQSNGLKASDVNDIALEFCRRYGYESSLDSMGGQTNALLKSLVDKEEIARVKIKGVYYYFKKG